MPRRTRPGFPTLGAAILLTALSGLFHAAPAGRPPLPRETEIVSIAGADATAGRLRPLGLDLLDERDGRLYIVASPDDLSALENLRIPYVVESARFAPARPARELAVAGGINGDYHSYRELEADLERLAAANPDRAALHVIGRSLEGRTIYALEISDQVGRDEGEPGLLVLGCHHAREWISVEVPYLFAAHLLENYGLDQAVTAAVDGTEIWVVPLVNPDGLEYTIRAYRYWRKNRRLNADGSFGVDLNRNYGFAWGYDNEGSSGDPESEIYRGARPFSEPETDAVRRLVLGRSFRALVSYHSYSQVIMYPWGYADVPTGRDAELDGLAGRMSDLMAGLNGRTYAFGRAAAQLYVTNGDTVDWAFGAAGIDAFTIELPPVDVRGGGFFNAEAEIAPIFEENLRALLHLAKAAAATAPSGPPSAREPVRPDARGPSGPHRRR